MKFSTFSALVLAVLLSAAPAQAESVSAGFLTLDLLSGWEMKIYREFPNQVIVFLYSNKPPAGNELGIQFVTGQADVKGVGDTLEAQTRMVAGIHEHPEAPLNKISDTGLWFEAPPDGKDSGRRRTAVCFSGDRLIWYTIEAGSGRRPLDFKALPPQSRDELIHIWKSLRVSNPLYQPLMDGCLEKLPPEFFQ